MNNWRLDITFGKETHVAQGHLDPVIDLMTNVGGYPAEVEIQALISGQFSNSRIVSTVRLNCRQTEEGISLAQEKATELAMEGLRNGWETLQERVAKGHFPGAGQ